MAHIPAFEELLAEIHQGLGLQRDPRKPRFVAFELGFDAHVAMAGKLIAEIFEALDMDGPACLDAVHGTEDFGQFHKALELRTWTGNASQKQVVWHLLAYSYLPALARHLAFWTLHNIQNDLPPLDAGMPGGKFWFLPNWDRDNDRIDLPVKQVVAWLFDLLGGQSQEKAVGGLQREIDGKAVNSDVLRTLQGWYLEGRLPKSAKIIEQIFSDEASLIFEGAFLLAPLLSADEQFQAALAFTERKGLGAEALRDEIPMTVDQLRSILNGSARGEERQRFIDLIAERYAEPDMRTIRLRLRVARLFQDGYERLLKFLCPGVEIGSTDPGLNRLLQLIGLFGTIYNLTVAASNKANSIEAQDAWFEAQLSPWDKADLLMSILPSLPGETRCTLLAERLTRKFMNLAPDSPLEDLVPLSADDGPIIERRLLLIEQQRHEDDRLKHLVERVRNASPWRALQAEDNYWVVSQFAHREHLPPAVRDMALQRMRTLAIAPGQKVTCDVVELGWLLHCEPKHRPKDIQQRVRVLLDVAGENIGYEEWEAPLLRLRAKHRLFQNEFALAEKDFKAALDACSDRGFGGLRGEIARDALATAIAQEGFIAQTQQGYYRNMLGYMEFPRGTPSFEDAATECEEFFWTNLYQPYPGIKRQDGPAIIQYKAIFEETFDLIQEADWDGLQDWFRSHAKEFRTTTIKDARRNSVLLQWLKMLRPQGNMLPRHFRGNWRNAIHLVLEAWPEQAKIADFKGQTPLMLVADNGDAELTRMLMPLSDVDAHDHLGRTALHAAAAGRSPECVAIVLECNPDVSKVTLGEENNALHTAVRFGVPEGVHRITHEFPSLLSKVNADGLTPLDMARDIQENHAEWVTYMHSEHRQTGSKADFDQIVALLKEFGMQLNH